MRFIVAAALLLAVTGCLNLSDPYRFASDSGVVDQAGGCGRSCTAPPPTHCTSPTMLESYPAQGRCIEGGCSYSVVATQCAGACTNGRCDSDPCAGVFCDRPPAARCDDASHLRVFAAGACVAGGCAYTASVVACDCVDGSCAQNRCVGKTCVSPPPNECLDSTTLKLYATPGACDAADGTCSYGSTTVPCANGCSHGACVADPCAGVSCQVAPAATCVSSSVLRTFSTPGVCAAGQCSYSARDTLCDSGKVCSNGACQTPSPVCTTATCPTGCCAQDTCVTRDNQTDSQCGSGAATCGGCGQGYRCAQGTCADIDECASNMGGCDLHAACVNTPGSHQCICAVGYTGDGTTCRAIDGDGGVNTKDGGAPVPDAGSRDGGGSTDAGGTCNATNCDGCCLGTTCHHRADYETSSTCGRITAGPGAACITCPISTSCSIDAGVCLSLLGDCNPNSVDASGCRVGECCDYSSLISNCRPGGSRCHYAFPFGDQVCNAVSRQCESP